MRLGGDIQYSEFSNGVRYVLGWCCVFVTMLPDTIDDSSTSTTCLYLSPSQLCLQKRIRDFKGLFYLNLGHSYLYASHPRTVQAGQYMVRQGSRGGGEGIWQDARHLKQCIRNF